MSKKIGIDNLQPGDELRFHGLRLGRGPLRTRVLCRSARFIIFGNRIGGTDRHLIVDLEARTRRPVPKSRVGGQESTRWSQQLLDDLDAGRVPASKVALPLDIVLPATAS